MGLFDWLGPLNAGSNKARGWGALPAPVIKSPIEQKASWLIDDYRAVVVNTLVHGPGATDLLAGAYGDASNSAVFACLQVIATAIAEPELKVLKLGAGEKIEQPDSPLADLLKRPNPHMTLDALLAYLSNCLHVDGNAYWRKLRAGNPDTGNVVELWPISPSRIEPRTQRGSGDFISFYRYYLRPGVHEDIPIENVVHFRMGLDDKDHRVGLSPLKRLVREVSSDGQATRYADRLLANLAINGLSVEWDKETQGITPAVAEEVKARVQAAYGGDNVGAVSVLSPGAKLVSHGFSPEQMDLKVLHRVPEERIAAVLGVPAIVAGLGAGLDRSTYSNFKEAREAYTEMKLIPLWRALAASITLQLLPDFASDANTVVEFFVDEVRALQDDQNAKAVRLKTYVDAGILDVNEARAEIGREPRALVTAPPPADVTAPGDESLPVTRSRAPLTIWGRPVLDLDGLKRERARHEAAFSKSLDDLPGAYDRLKDDRLPDWEAELRTFLDQQQRRVNARLRSGDDSAESLVSEGEAQLLGDTLRPLQAGVLRSVSDLVVAELGIEFGLDDPATRAYLSEAGANVGGITDTTRDAVRAALIEGQRNGEGIDQLARRLRELPAFGEARARVVARSELGHAANTAALANYRASGVVVGVRVFDGDYDAPCAAMNGRTFNLGSEPSSLQHPNCRRAFAPIVDASEMERSA